MLMMQPAAVGTMGAGVFGVAQLAVENVTGGTPTGIEQYFLQLGAVGLAIAVGFWLIRRYDARSDAAAHEALTQLERERAAHEATRQMLMNLLKEQHDK
jgi:hypothetical protein